MTRKLSILLIGGGEATQMLLTEAFEEYNGGADVKTMINSQEGMQYLQIKAQNHDAPPPDAIIIHEIMTNIAGCMVLQFIRDHPWLSKIPHFVIMPASLVSLTECADDIEACLIETPISWDDYAIIVKKVCHSAKKTWNIEDISCPEP